MSTSIPEQETIVLLRRLVGQFDRSVGHQLQQEFLISYSHFLILIHIDKFPDIDQRTIACNIQLTEAAISKYIHKMTEEGLVQTVQSSSDRRRKNLKITAKGHKLLERAYQLFLREGQELLSILSPNEQKMLRQCILKLFLAFDSSTPPEQIPTSTKSE